MLQYILQGGQQSGIMGEFHWDKTWDYAWISEIYQKLYEARDADS